MNRIQIFLVLIFTISVGFSQKEKRLALVIGNSDYDKGALKNPVNDALLIAETLDSLDFDVILDTNLTTKRDFRNKIIEFGDKRPEYDVAFVYYAGHGVQVNNENYLLPTKEEFKSEYDVEDFGVSVQM
ncbi:MAG: caspase family protein, partial [Flavobacteriales bacterium]|nr:caspase family protein [Flavobacteriales bacterium]